MNDMILIALGVWLLTILSAVVGAYLMFKGIKSVPGEKFLGGVPKGQVFSIPEVDDIPESPEDEEKAVLKNTEKFLKILGGK